jgi:MFS family permease
MSWARRWLRSPVWRNRDFSRYWVGQTINVFGSGITGFALPLVAILTLHATPAQMGLLRGVGSVPTIAIGLFAGVWVDRVSRRRLLITMDVLAALLVLTIPLGAALGFLSITQLFVLALAFGVLDPFWWPAWNAFLPTLVGPDLLVDANSKILFSWSANGVVSPALGGLLVHAFSAAGAMVVDAASYIVSAFVTASVHPAERTRSKAESPPMLVEIREGVRATFLDRMQRAVTIPRAILDLIDAMSAAVIVLYIIREVGMDAAQLGIAFAISSLGFVLGSVVAPRIARRLGIGGSIVLGLALVAVSPYSMLVASRSHTDLTNVLCFILPGWIGGFGGIVQYSGLNALRQQITPDELLGRVFATARTLGETLFVIGAIGGGLLAEAVGLRPTLIVIAVGYAVPVLYALASPLRTARGAIPADDDARAPAPEEELNDVRRSDA